MTWFGCESDSFGRSFYIHLRCALFDPRVKLGTFALALQIHELPRLELLKCAMPFFFFLNQVVCDAHYTALHLQDLVSGPEPAVF